jgi:hypothetical protein
LETPDTDSLIKIWTKLMDGSTKSWVLFRYGTCVLFEHPVDDLKGEAIRLMKEWGPVQVATPSADFNVLKLIVDPGWIVTCHHPGIITFVGPAELNDTRISDVFIGLTGRSKRASDASELQIIYIQANAI